MQGASCFVGRDEDCERVSALLSEHRLVTLVGTGGVGKTRLATELSARRSEGFAAGRAAVVELSGAGGHEDLGPIAARELGVDSIEALLLRDSDGGALIVLDNCESALEGARRLADTILEGSKDIRLLATSRSPLRSLHERVFPVRPLALSAGDGKEAFDSPAARLLLDRARAAGASWTDAAEDMSGDVMRLVRKLDGLPLAIELAAARSRMLGPSELDALLDEHPDLLRRGNPEVGDRHHSLQTVIATSYEPLGSEPQRFLRSLCTLTAPFDAELAHEVAGAPRLTLPDSLERLTELVDASLVDAQSGEDGFVEYRLLDSIRSFGRERLADEGELASAQEHFVDAMVAQADQLVRDALESFSAEVLGRVRNRFVHLAAAVSWCVEHDPSPARAYRLFLPFYGPTGARAEVAELAKKVRRCWTESAALQAEAWAVMATSTFLNGDYEEGAALAAQVLGHPDASPLAKMWAHRTLGFVAAVEGDPARAAEELDRAIEFAMPLGASFTRELQISRAAVELDPAAIPAALDLLYEIGRDAAQSNEIATLVWASIVGASQRFVQGDAAGARRSSEAAVDAADRSGLNWSIATAHRTHASVVAATDGWEAARPHFLRAFEETLAAGDIEGVAMALRAAAGAAMYVGDEVLAEALWGTIPPLPGLPVLRSIFHPLEEQLLAKLGPPPPLDTTTLARSARRLIGAPRSDAATESVGCEPDVVRFADCELDLAMQELRRDGERVHVEPQVFDVLAFLVARRGAVVSTDEILSAVWGDRFVTPDSVTSRIAAARRAAGDDGRTQRIIRTVRGKGFSFVAEVEGD